MILRDKAEPGVKEKLNILMVDDQPAKLLSYEVILSELGENLIKATSGREALELLLKDDIAIVLMDVSMPDMDGFEVADMMHQHPRFQDTPIIFISGVHLTSMDHLKGYQRGAVDYISVPIVPELLRAKVSVFAELHRRTRQLEVLNGQLLRLSNRLIAAQDAERRRISRELHDGLGQELAVAKIMADQIYQTAAGETQKQLSAELTQAIERAIQQTRTISHLLHPPMLEEVGFIPAIKWYLDGLSRRSGIHSSLDVHPPEFPRLLPELETAIFRIIQEALTNVFRHARANNVWVSVTQRDSKVTLAVRDDGIGARILEFRPDSVGVGIGGMRQRTKELGGELRIINASPGTMVEAVIPLKRLTSQEARATA
jgi:signal transduction histidine kinase